MANVTFEKTSSKLVKVAKDGAFAGWLEQGARRTTGLHGERFTFWSGTVSGTHVSAPTLTAAKAKAEAVMRLESAERFGDFGRD